MFDVEKVRRMTDELPTFVREHDEIFLTFESMSGETVALFHRLQIKVRAIISDDPSKPIDMYKSFAKNSMHEEFLKFPVMKTSDAAKNFSERTGIIAIVKKPLPIFQTELPFVINGRRMDVPTFILSPDEIFAMYDRLTIMNILRQYQEDGLCPPPRGIAERFARGLTTFLDPRFQNFKYHLLDRREQFNPRYDFDDAAIVIQGPLVYENNYTAVTVEFYRSIYPNAPIVVSTWTGEATADFRDVCRKNSVALLENEMPELRGPWNVNCQLKSSFLGVKYVSENTAAKFVLKTRSDQRIDKPDFLTYFKNLSKTFPPLGDKLQGRIILLDGSKWLPFRASDFVVFGCVRDLFKFYNIKYPCEGNDDLTYRTNHNKRFRVAKKFALSFSHTNFNPPPNDKKFRKFNRVIKPFTEVEAYILKRFYVEQIGAIDETKIVETGRKFVRDYLLFLGKRSVSLDWPKYESHGAYSVDESGGFTDELNFSRWLDLYRNCKLDWV